MKKSRAWAGMTGVLLFGLSTLAATAAGPPAVILSSAADASNAGMVRLELAPLLAGDAEGSLRLQAVVRGPLAGEGADDLYAFNAVLVVAGADPGFVKGSLRKGDFFDGHEGGWMVTAAAAPGEANRVTIGGSRIGAVPGVAAAAGDRVLFSFALQARGSGPITLAWQDATFIDTRVRPVDVARFADATLQWPEGEGASPSEDHQ